MNLSLFDYSLPQELIAQYPCRVRDEARLFVVDRARGTFTHDIFRNVGRYLPPSSLIVVNDTRVVPARLLGQKVSSGAKVEVFILRHCAGRRYEAMLKPLKKIKENEALVFPGGVSAVLVDREARVVEFDRDDVVSFLEQAGHIPLPPYIKRPDEASDREDYQTVYARAPGSVAAPTAGLHFTPPLISSLKKQGHLFGEVTLHVNYGTFKPVEEEDITLHRMHAERYEISAAVKEAFVQAQALGRKMVLVGTTSCRTMEAFARTGRLKDETSIFLYPGAEFKATDVLITNFHLPRSTLLMLVCAFGGLDLIRRAYDEAVREKYRFYSYGDAMIIV